MPARPVTFATTQFACTWDGPATLDRAEAEIRAAARAGGQVICVQELFAAPYFCIAQDPRHFALAAPAAGHPLIARFSDLARELGVVLPVSFFEAAGPAFFNSVMMIDADGRQMGLYRKSHIPQGVGYEEKFYFSPGDTGFRVWDTAFGRIGCGICWDQWFPETARAMALMGAEALLYPTAIGSEPAAPDYDSQPHWQRVMQGHAAANILPVIAANRIGVESSSATTGTQSRAISFYGSSFIADHRGQMLAELDRESQGFATATLDLAEIAELRASWGLFRDRRVDLYAPLASLTGQ